jgi:hypothetical protein
MEFAPPKLPDQATEFASRPQRRTLFPFLDLSDSASAASIRKSDPTANVAWPLSTQLKGLMSGYQTRVRNPAKNSKPHPVLQWIRSQYQKGSDPSASRARPKEKLPSSIFRFG